MEAAAILRFGMSGRALFSNAWHLAVVNGDENGFIFTASCIQDNIVAIPRLAFRTWAKTIQFRSIRLFELDCERGFSLCHRF